MRIEELPTLRIVRISLTRRGTNIIISLKLQRESSEISVKFLIVRSLDHFGFAHYFDVHGNTVSTRTMMGSFFVYVAMVTIAKVILCVKQTMSKISGI